MGRKTTEQKAVINNLNKIYLSGKEVMQKWSLMQATKQNKMK